LYFIVPEQLSCSEPPEIFLSIYMAMGIIRHNALGFVPLVVTERPISLNIFIIHKTRLSYSWPDCRRSWWMGSPWLHTWSLLVCIKNLWCWFSL